MRSLPPLLGLCMALHAHGQDRAGAYTRADTLRGSVGPGRAWWDAVAYDVSVRPDFASRSISGRTVIAFDAVAEGQRMQIDLQQPLVVDSVTTEVARFADGAIAIADARVPVERNGDVAWVVLPEPMKPGMASTLTVHYHGTPRQAANPPWDGGWVWRTDARGNPWATVACQGLGASCWYPCKDHQGDEPQRGAFLRITVPDSLQAIGNGRLRGAAPNGDGTATWSWQVESPINTYNLVPYIGRYERIPGTFEGAEGPIDLAFWVLKHHAPPGPGSAAADEAALAEARKQFEQVPAMLRCFEEWFGPYPFRADGYQLVEAPHLGMEHQSAIAYGNGFANGYLGRDLSGTGHGLRWDYIIVHESGHEWFGNSITAADIADMWVHEGFTDYSEALFTECQQGREAAEEYVIGLRRLIRNDRPIIGPYGVNAMGSGDMYYKGANLIHTIRAIVGDNAFRAMLLEMNRRFRHGITTSAEVESFLIGFNAVTRARLGPALFDQYLRTNKVPVLEWGRRKGRNWLRWANAVPRFAMPVRLEGDPPGSLRMATDAWQPCTGPAVRPRSVRPDRNWYVLSRNVPRRALKQALRAGRSAP